MAERITNVQALRLGPQGRLVIPAEWRRILSLEPGDTVVAWIEGDRLVVRARHAVEEELWSMFANDGRSLAAELLQERREEARRENEQ